MPARWPLIATYALRPTTDSSGMAPSCWPVTFSCMYVRDPTAIMSFPTLPSTPLPGVSTTSLIAGRDWFSTRADPQVYGQGDALLPALSPPQDAGLARA